MTARGRGATADRTDRGQATVELALALPLVVTVLLLVVQVGVVVRDQLLVTHAAREAARTASVVAPGDDADVAASARAAGPLDPTRLDAAVVDGGDGLVRVRVSYRSRTDLPLIGGLVPDLTLDASAAMRRE
jgi:Flp pilus assembly protein TadG